jgi:hypothetical protein
MTIQPTHDLLTHNPASPPAAIVVARRGAWPAPGRTTCRCRATTRRRPSPALTQRARPVAGESYTPVVVPNGSTCRSRRRRREGLPPGRRAGQHEIAPGLEIEAWGYNGSTPGPLIEAVEGDRVRIYVTNKLPEPTTVHWHGVFLPNGMDGVAGLNQPIGGRRDLQVRVHGSNEAGHVHVPPALRRDDPDGAGHDGHVRRPPAAAYGQAHRSRLRR